MRKAKQERLEAKIVKDKLRSVSEFKNVYMDIDKIQAREDIKEIRLRLDRLEKFLNERNSVDEVKKLFVPCGICHCPDSCIPARECYNDWQDNK